MSKQPKNINKSGFTIIEVVLVLAIAGLIFLMVFVAFPALQRNQRDTQRRTDVGRMITAVTTFKADKNKLPDDSTSSTELSSYLDEFKDPGTSSAYTVVVKTLTATDGAGSETDGNVYLYKNAKCGSTGATFADKGAGYFAVVVKAENGGVICQDNS